MDNPTKTTRGPKIALMGGIAVLAIVAIVYFSFFYPPAKTEDLSGTIGAAKKYRSEQITDKDVKLEGQASEAVAGNDAIADVQAAHEFAATASAFEKSFKALDSRVKLDATFRASYQRAAEVLNSVAQSLGRAAKSTYDAREVADLQSSAAALERAASAVVANRAQVTLDRAAATDMQARMRTIDARARNLEARLSAVLESRATIDSRASATIDARAKVDAKAQANKQQNLDNKAQ